MKKKLDPQEKARRQAWRDQRYEEHIRSEQEKAKLKAAAQESGASTPRSGNPVLTVGALAAATLLAGVEAPRL